MLTTLVIGLVQGVIYGLVALGLVLIYKGSRVFNFAQGEFATMSMYILYQFVSPTAWPGRHLAGIPGSYILGVLVALIVAVGFALATERFVVRLLRNAPPVISLVGTAGAALLAIGVQLFLFGLDPRTPDPAVGGSIRIAGFFVTGQQILSLITLAAVAVAAALFFQRTYLGMGILANSQDGFAARVVGANANRISAITWGIAGLMGGLAGVLLGPDVTIVPGYMTTSILVPAFAAAVVGGMTSLVGAFGGGVIIGLVGAFTTKPPFLDEIPLWLAKIPERSEVAVFLVLILVLAARPQGLFGSET